MLSNIVDTALASAHYAGLWVENGYTYIDNSIHVDSLELAVSLARKYNQLSIWDWKNSKCIYVRHEINKELLLNNIRIIKRGYLYDIYAYMSYMTDFELQYKGLDFFKLIDVIRNDYELEDTLIKEVIEFTKY